MYTNVVVIKVNNDLQVLGFVMEDDNSLHHINCQTQELFINHYKKGGDNMCPDERLPHSLLAGVIMPESILLRTYTDCRPKKVVGTYRYFL